MSHEHDVTPPRDGASQPSNPSSTPASDPLDVEALVDELARVFADGGEATLLAQRAGVPSGWIPAVDVPLVFWHRIIKAAEDGKVSGGAGAIARAAAKLYPNNHVFRGWARAGQPAGASRALVVALLGFVAVATAVAAWQWWPAPPRPDEHELVAAKQHDPPAFDGAVDPPAGSNSTTPEPTPRSSTTTSDDTSGPPPPAGKKPGPKKPPRPAPPPTPTADPRRWKVLDALTIPERFVGKRLTLDAHAPAGTVLTLATRCEAPTTSTAGPRCLVREDPDDPAGHYCVTRDSIPVGASLCIHPQGTKAEAR